MAVSNPIPTTMVAGNAYAITVTVDSSSDISIEYNGVEILSSTTVADIYVLEYTPTISGGIINVITENGIQGTVAYAPKIPDYHSMLNNGVGVLKFMDVEGKRSWSTHLTFQPEYMATLDDNLYSFMTAWPYVHNGNRAEFYGVEHDSILAFRVSGQNGVVELLDYITLESNIKPSYVHIVTSDPYNQATDLCEPDFVSLEGTYFASFLRDKLSPNFPDSSQSVSWAQALQRGDRMRSKYFDVFFVFNNDQELNLKAVNVGSTVSSGHRKEIK